MDNAARRYLSEIGRRGGRASKRTLTPEQAREMVRVRLARRAFRDHFTECFWYCDPQLDISKTRVPWVAQQLRKHGDDATWLLADRLCR